MGTEDPHNGRGFKVRCDQISVPSPTRIILPHGISSLRHFLGAIGLINPSRRPKTDRGHYFPASIESKKKRCQEKDASKNLSAHAKRRTLHMHPLSDCFEPPCKCSRFGLSEDTAFCTHR